MIGMHEASPSVTTQTTEQRLRVIDSHTGGEPTRLIIAGGPALTGSFNDQITAFQSQHDRLRVALCTEPRASEICVGGLLIPPTDSHLTAGVLFFNHVGYLGMCGHGTIGLVTTLAWLGRIAPGTHRIETPVGIVSAELHTDGRVSVTNVPSYRYAHRVSVRVPGYGMVTGDVAWGGNWFFICEDHGRTLDRSHLQTLVAFSVDLRQALTNSGITGAQGAPIDHIELLGPAGAGCDAKNFVLCPGQVYDRSACGTGTSARLACLVAEGRWTAGKRYRVQSIIGSVFEGTVRQINGEVIPTITGQAWVTADSTLILNQSDPYCFGLT